MKHSGWTSALGLFAAVAASGCLSEGAPPLGQQVWAGRAGLLADVLPARSPDDGVARILARRPRPGEEYQADLFAVVVPPAGGPVKEVLLAERHTCASFGPCVQVDHRGRAFVWSTEATTFQLGMKTLARVDPDTGERVDFGMRSRVLLSPSRQRALIAMEYGEVDSRLIGPDDETVVLSEGTRDFAFIGEDLYFVNGAHEVARLAPGVADQTVKTGVVSMSVVPSVDSASGTRLLLVPQDASVSSTAAVSLLDPVTGEEMTFPAGVRTEPSFSPDGRWALVRDTAMFSRRMFKLLEVATGNVEAFELPVDVIEPIWRPGRPELWCVASEWPDRTTYIKSPGQPLRTLPEDVVPLSAVVASLFSSDGEHLYSTRGIDVTQQRAVFVGATDQPEGPRFPLNPPGTTYVRRLELPDGRLVVEAVYGGGGRSDMYVVDPGDGTTRLLGRTGNVVQIGAERVLLLTHRVQGAGDLVDVAVDGTPGVTLGTEFVTTAYTQPRSGDGARSFGSGVRVAFQFRARFASPYDGIWLATIP